jgi:hypothetical protein
MVKHTLPIWLPAAFAWSIVCSIAGSDSADPIFFWRFWTGSCSTAHPWSIGKILPTLADYLSCFLSYISLCYLLQKVVVHTKQAVRNQAVAALSLRPYPQTSRSHGGVEDMPKGFREVPLCQSVVVCHVPTFVVLGSSSEK